jgi:hypothetical protein
MTAQAVAARWCACGPWVKALLRRMLPMPALAALPPGLRLVGIDASRLQAPGAPGPDSRLPSARDLLTLQCGEGRVSAVHRGETLQHCTLRTGAVAVADRGSAHAPGIPEAVQQGAEGIVRWHPCSVVLGDPTGQPLACWDAWQRQPMATIRTLAVGRPSAGGQHEGRGWVHAYR